MIYSTHIKISHVHKYVEQLCIHNNLTFFSKYKKIGNVKDNIKICEIHLKLMKFVWDLYTETTEIKEDGNI